MGGWTMAMRALVRVRAARLLTGFLLDDGTGEERTVPVGVLIAPETGGFLMRAGRGLRSHTVCWDRGMVQNEFEPALAVLEEIVVETEYGEGSVAFVRVVEFDDEADIDQFDMDLDSDELKAALDVLKPGPDGTMPEIANCTLTLGQVPGTVTVYPRPTPITIPVKHEPVVKAEPSGHTVNPDIRPVAIEPQARNPANLETFLRNLGLDEPTIKTAMALAARTTPRGGN